MPIVGAAAALRDQVQRLGGRVAYASTSAPVVFVDLPAAAVAGVARRDDVLSLGLEGAWSPSMSTAGRAVDANWTSGERRSAATGCGWRWSSTTTCGAAAT